MAFMNDLLKLWLTKETVKKEMTDIRKYVDRIDTYTLYEFYSNQISEEELKTAIANFRPRAKQKGPRVKKSEVVDTTWKVNPERMCVYSGNSPWDRCIYCNSIRKYMKDKECLKFKENLGDTVTKNE